MWTYPAPERIPTLALPIGPAKCPPPGNDIPVPHPGCVCTTPTLTTAIR